MFKQFKPILSAVLAGGVLIAIGASAYSAFALPAVSTFTSPSNGFGVGRGNGGENDGFLGTEVQQIDSIPPSDLSTEEAAGLLFMREEEKLARDVYNQLYTLWGQQIFKNIASSEQTHMDQVKLLLDRYGLPDPALAAGQFTDPSLQTMYDQLIAQGLVSLGEAMNVGILIEQTDIGDLQARLVQTDNADIQMVYNNLIRASNNHLYAFTTGGGQGSGRGYGQGGNGNRP